MRIALYGLPCAGKTTILSALKDIKIVNGSAELNRMSRGSFKTLNDDDKNRYRIQYIEYLMSLQDDIVLSDGHYSFLEDIVFTEHDAAAYDIFIYLYCSAETLLGRYACSEKNKSYADLSIARIEQWQIFEIESIRRECHSLNKDFYVLNGEINTAEDLARFLDKIKNGYSSHAIAEDIVKHIKTIYPEPCAISLVDGDKTFIVQDSFRVCSHRYRTTAFDGNFYTGYQSLQFAEEVKAIEYDYGLLRQIEINKQVFDRVKNTPYFVISAGITELWEQIARMHHLKNVIASPVISADTKYFVVKMLRDDGYTINAYGDSKNDLYMLQAANEGYLCTTERLSKSLISANTSNLRLIYDRSMVVLNEVHTAELSDEIAICKSKSGINGSRLAQAHYSLGQKIGQEMSKTIPSNDAAVVVLERGGRFFGDGVYITFGGKFYPFTPSKEPLPVIDASTIIIVDSVINTGKSLLKVIDSIRSYNPNAEIIVVANVIQEKAVPLLDGYKVYAIRVSKNAFEGRNQATQTGSTGPDTADRLFNLIKTQ